MRKKETLGYIPPLSNCSFKSTLCDIVLTPSMATLKKHSFSTKAICIWPWPLSLSKKTGEEEIKLSLFAGDMIPYIVQSPSHGWLFATPWSAAHQASLSFTTSWSFPKFMSIESVMPSSHLILWCPLLLLSSLFPSIRDFSNESAICIRWPKYYSLSFSISIA